MIARRQPPMQFIDPIDIATGLKFARLILCVMASSIAMPSVVYADGVLDSNRKLSFNRDIKPILADKCLACHGVDEAERQGDLRLDDRDAAIQAGAFNPEDVKSSTLIVRIHSTDPDTVMPPPDAHKELTPEEKKLLEEWIVQGAEYEKHWSFELPKAPVVPSVMNEAWVRNPIDSFVLSKLEQLKLAPAEEADLRTLVRRVCLDLTGLPPTPQEIEEVVNDPSPDRYEQYVDRLLNRETWGEHRARYWLDYARYADTHGIHFDNYREMYSYRDWVIRAFNQNMPFNQFTIEQLAGDLLPNPTLDQKIATGFHRCNITTNEGGIIDEEYVVLYARDRVETTGTVFLGLTLGCAVCHNHKFDPISQKEFYELSAFFNNTTQGPRDGNRKDTPPVVIVPLMEDRLVYEKTKSEREVALQKVQERRNSITPEFENWMKSGAASEKIDATYQAAFKESNAKLVFHAPLTETSGQQISFTSGTSEVSSKLLSGDLVSTGGAVAPSAWVNQANLTPTWKSVGDFDVDQAFSVSLWIKPLKNNTSNGAVIARMDPANGYRGWDVWLENGRVAMHLIHRWQEDACKVATEQSLLPENWNHVVFTYDGSKKSSAFKCYVNGQASKLRVLEDRLQSTTKTDVAFRLGGRNVGADTNGVGTQDLRIYEGVLTDSAIAALSQDSRTRYLVERGIEKLNDQERNSLLEFYLTRVDTEYPRLKSEADRLEGEIKAIEQRGTVAHVMAERDSKPIAYVLQRGDYDKRQEEVSPRTPIVLHPMREDLPKNRLGLATWLTSENNPLTARVTVNRCWQELFGRGIVGTTGDFGITGMLPTNQDLLDYLALDFQQSGWDVKQLYRQIVSSSTYRQSAKVTPEKLSVDPDNSYLSRGPRYRMDAEMLRDYALAVSGLMNPIVGGRSVRPYQPPGVWEAVAMPESDTRNYRLDDQPMLYRRSMYTFWKRAAPPASMEALNAPAREVCTVKRERTNTPLQALVTMNDPQFVEAARVLAQNALQEKSLSTEQDRIQWVASKIIGRTLSVEELPVVEETLKTALEYYGSNSAEATKFVSVGLSPRNEALNVAEHAAWTLVANQLLNLDEALCK